MNQQELHSLHKKAEQGDAEAQFQLGKHYDGKDESEAVKWYRRAAEQGHAKAQNNLGSCLTDPDEAAEWFLRGAENGSVAAQFNIGRYYLESHQDAAGLREALRWLHCAAENGNDQAKREISYLKKVEGLLGKAEQGDAEAMCGIAKIFEDYVPRNSSRTFLWFLQAAENGSRDAQFEVGSRYLSGDGVREEDKAACTWFVKAAEQGHLRARQAVVARTEFDLVSKAAENGDAGSQFQLGMFYASGHGVKASDNMAVHWFEKAAKQGHPEAMYELGKHLSVRCHAVSPDAFEWFRKAAELGCAKAQFALGRCFGNGAVVKKDLIQAVYWFLKAAEQDLPEAQFALAECYQADCVVKKNDSESLEWLQKAAGHHCPGALFEIGMRHFSGKGAKQDYAFAFECFLRAACEFPVEDESADPRDKGEWGDVWHDGLTPGYDRNLTPMDMLCRCYAEGLGVQKNDERAHEWHYRACLSRGILVD